MGCFFACCKASTWLHIYSDCQTVVEQSKLIFAGSPVDPTWKCWQWWCFLKDIVVRRSVDEYCPFHIDWIPAHKLESVPIPMLTDELAHLAQTTVRHIIHNRLVDGAAGDFALRIAPINPKMRQELIDAIRQHQNWLTRLHELLPTKEPGVTDAPQVCELPNMLTPEQCRARYPHCLWDAHPSSFRWKLKVPNSHPPPRNWTSSVNDWDEICRFLRSLRWKTGADFSFSFCELAAVFHSGGFRVQVDAQMLTFRELTNMIQKAMQILSKDDTVDAFPGIFNSTRPRSCGRVSRVHRPRNSVCETRRVSACCTASCERCRAHTGVLGDSGVRLLIFLCADSTVMLRPVCPA